MKLTVYIFTFLTFFFSDLSAKDISIYTNDLKTAQKLNIDFSNILTNVVGELEVKSSDESVLTLKYSTVNASIPNNVVYIHSYGSAFINVYLKNKAEIQKSFNVNIYNSKKQNSNRYRSLKISDPENKVFYNVNPIPDLSYLRTFYISDQIKDSESASIKWTIEPRYATQMVHTSEDSVVVYMKSNQINTLRAIDRESNEVIANFFFKRNGKNHLESFYDIGKKKVVSGSLQKQFRIVNSYPNQRAIQVGDESILTSFEKKLKGSLGEINAPKYGNDTKIQNLNFLSIDVSVNDTLVIYQPEFIRHFSTSDFYNQDSIDKLDLSKFISIRSFSKLFYKSTQLSSIPVNVFSNNPSVKELVATFSECKLLKSIPSNLFQSNTNLNDLRECFYNADNISQIPTDLFPSSWSVENGLVKNNDGELVRFDDFIGTSSDPILFDKDKNSYVYSISNPTNARELVIKQNSNSIQDVPEEIAANQYFQMLCDFTRGRKGKIELANGDVYIWDGHNWLYESVFSYTNPTSNSIVIQMGAFASGVKYSLNSVERDIPVASINENGEVLNKAELNITIPAGQTIQVRRAYYINYLSHLVLNASPTTDMISNLVALKSVEELFVDNSSILSIPSGFFNKNTQILNAKSCFKNCQNLVTIPSSLFLTTKEVRSFESIFENCSQLLTLPANLFAGAEAARSFKNSFKNCTRLVGVNASAFQGAISAVDFESVFENCSSLSSLPQFLFERNSKAENFKTSFKNCTNINSIPKNFFGNQGQIYTLESCFEGTSLNTNQLPVELFQYQFRGLNGNLYNANTRLVSFSNLFGDYTGRNFIFKSETSDLNFRSAIKDVDYFRTMCEFGVNESRVELSNGVQYGWDGTKWLSVEEYINPMGFKDYHLLESKETNIWWTSNSRVYTNYDETVPQLYDGTRSFEFVPTGDGSYNIKSKNGLYLYAESSSSEIKTTNANTSLDEEHFQWSFKKIKDRYYAIKNKKYGYYIYPKSDYSIHYEKYDKSPYDWSKVWRIYPDNYYSSWMKYLDGTKYISDFSIPGTHDSGARGGSSPIPDEQTQCQSLSIDYQLLAGVRFFDLRLVQTSNDFKVYHGIEYQDIKLSQCLAYFYNFLNNNPSETILLSIKKEGDAESGVSKEFYQQLDQVMDNASNKSKWYYKNKMPKLADVRGKIVLIRRYSGNTNRGLQARSGFPNDGIGTVYGIEDGTIRVQDKYTTRTSNYLYKWDLTRNFIYDNNNRSANQLLMNFASAAGGGEVVITPEIDLGIITIPATTQYFPNPREIADKINPLLKGYLENSSYNTGIMIVDFVDVKMSKLIIRTNDTY